MSGFAQNNMKKKKANDGRAITPVLGKRKDGYNFSTAEEGPTSKHPHINMINFQTLLDIAYMTELSNKRKTLTDIDPKRVMFPLGVDDSVYDVEENDVAWTFKNKNNVATPPVMVALNGVDVTDYKTGFDFMNAINVLGLIYQPMKWKNPKNANASIGVQTVGTSDPINNCRETWRIMDEIMAEVSYDNSIQTERPNSATWLDTNRQNRITNRLTLILRPFDIAKNGDLTRTIFYVLNDAVMQAKRDMFPLCTASLFDPNGYSKAGIVADIAKTSAMSDTVTGLNLLRMLLTRGVATVWTPNTIGTKVALHKLRAVLKRKNLDSDNFDVASDADADVSNSLNELVRSMLKSEESNFDVDIGQDTNYDTENLVNEDTSRVLNPEDVSFAAHESTMSEEDMKRDVLDPLKLLALKLGLADKTKLKKSGNMSKQWVLDFIHMQYLSCLSGSDSVSQGLKKIYGYEKFVSKSSPISTLLQTSDVMNQIAKSAEERAKLDALSQSTYYKLLRKDVLAYSLRRTAPGDSGHVMLNRFPK